MAEKLSGNSSHMLGRDFFEAGGPKLHTECPLLPTALSHSSHSSKLGKRQILAKHEQTHKY